MSSQFECVRCGKGENECPAQLSEALDLLPPADRSDRYFVKLPREAYDRLRALLGGVWPAPPGTPVVDHSTLAVVLEGATLRDRAAALAASLSVTRERLALENIRALAARAKARKESAFKEGELDHLLRFCREGGVEGSTLRESPAPTAPKEPQR